MKQGKILVPGQVWKYEAVEERAARPDIGEYVTCGLRVDTAQGPMTLHDVSVEREFVERLAALFTDRQLDPVHLEEMTAEFVSYPEELERAAAQAQKETV